MSRVAIGKTPLDEKDMSFTEIAQYNLEETINHKYAHILNSGNGAIFTALASVTGKIILPNQGGWNGFKQISRFLDKPLESLEKSIEAIALSSESIKKACKNIDEQCDKVNRIYINQIVEKINKFELKLEKSIAKKLED